MLASVFEGARPIGVEAEKGRIRIGFPEAAKFNKRKAEAPDNVKLMAEAVESVVGRHLKPLYELVAGDLEPTGTDSPEPELGEDEMIEMIKSNFDASEVAPDLGPEPAAGGEEAS